MADNKNNEIIYDSLFKDYYAKLLFYATRFLNEDEAEDVVQDTFLELWRRKDSIEMGPYIVSFLYRSVYTRSINVLKHKKVKEGYCQALEEIYNKKIAYYHPDQEEVIMKLEAKELRDEINAGINELPQKCKEVFKLSYLHGLKNKEIADYLDLSVRTVEAHMYKALKFLREKLNHLHLLFVYFMGCL